MKIRCNIEQEERILRFMRIPPQRKLEWLYEMNKFIDKFSSKKTKKIRKKIRQMRSGAL